MDKGAVLRQLKTEDGAVSWFRLVGGNLEPPVWMQSPAENTDYHSLRIRTRNDMRFLPVIPRGWSMAE